MPIGFEEIEAINAIMEEGSFRAAAEKLHKAQSSISYAIKVLEKELGISIFDRSTYKPTLTSEGAIIFSKAKEILVMQNDLEELSKFLKSGIESQINLTTSIIFPQKELTGLLKDLKEKYSQTRINLNFGSFEYPLNLLKESKTDIAIANDYQNETSLEKVFFCSIDLIPVHHKNYPHKNKSLKSQVEIVVGDRSLNAKKRNEDIYEENETWHVTDYSLKKKLIEDSLGWGYMPDYLIEKELGNGDFMEMKKKNIQKINLYAYRNIRNNYGPVNEFLWQKLKSASK